MDVKKKAARFGRSLSEIRLEEICSCATGCGCGRQNLDGVTGNRVDILGAACCIVRKYFVAEVFEQPSGSGLDMCARTRVDP